MRRTYTHKEMLEKERLSKAASKLLRNLPKSPETKKERRERIADERLRNKKKHSSFKDRRNGFIP